MVYMESDGSVRTRGTRTPNIAKVSAGVHSTAMTSGQHVVARKQHVLGVDELPVQLGRVEPGRKPFCLHVSPPLLSQHRRARHTQALIWINGGRRAGRYCYDGGQR